MNSPGGYAGSILKVDLTGGKISIDPFDFALAARFIGGAGLNTRLAYDLLPEKAHWFSPQVPLVLGAGPLVGTLAPSASRTNFTSKSPLSDLLGTSGAGEMGRLKFCGYDHLIIQGKANSAVYLEIGDSVRLRDARHLWGKDTWETVDTLRHELGEGYTVAAIGPAGENLVKTASIMVNKNTAFGRTGLGAVMGAKNLKAIALKGTHGVRVADPERFISLVNALSRQIRLLPDLKDWRAVAGLTQYEERIRARGKTIPVKNSREIAGPDFSSILDPQEARKITGQSRSISCLACPVGCKHFVNLSEGHYAGPAMTIGCLNSPVTSFGGLCAVAGWEHVFKCCEVCNRLGLDQVTSSLIAMAIELFQRGIIDRGDTGGLDLDWGQPDIVRLLLWKIAYREGFGDLLADGPVEAARRIGRGADQYAPHYKGVPSTAGDPRPALATWTRSLITSAAGQAVPLNEMCMFTPQEAANYLRHKGLPDDIITSMTAGDRGYDQTAAARWVEDYIFALECLGLCAFLNQSFGIHIWAQVYAAATGLEIDGTGLLKAAARGIDMRRAFNLREGASREDDTIPRRFTTESIMVNGEMRPPFSETQLESLVTEYYDARGWQTDGTLKEERLRELLEET